MVLRPILVGSILAKADTREVPGSKSPGESRPGAKLGADQGYGFRRQAHTSPEKLVTKAASAIMTAASSWIIAYLLAGNSITYLVIFVKNKKGILPATLFAHSIYIGDQNHSRLRVRAAKAWDQYWRSARVDRLCEQDRMRYPSGVHSLGLRCTNSISIILRCEQVHAFLAWPGSGLFKLRPNVDGTSALGGKRKATQKYAAGFFASHPSEQKGRSGRKPRTFHNKLI